MTLNRLSLSFFIIAIVVFFNIKTWGSSSIEIIESNPCKYSTYSVLQDLEEKCRYSNWKCLFYQNIKI